MIETISDRIVTEIAGFEDPIDGDDLIVDRSYHDDDAILTGKVIVDVYPLTRRKQREGRGTKIVEASFYIAVSRKLKPKDRDRIDATIDYVLRLDAHFESLGKLDDATYILNDDEQFLWFPELLHIQNKFVSLIELRYAWKALLGD